MNKLRDKVLVTGGAGYIGSHTVVELHNAGYEPVILDNFSNTEHKVILGIESILGQEITVCEEDCNNRDAVRRIIEEHGPFAGVIHFAAYKSVSESVREPLSYYENNIVSLVTILQECLASEIPNFIFSSSCTVYGQPENLPVTESTPIQKSESPYGSTKIVGETVLTDLTESLQKSNSESALKVIALRYFNPIGAHPSAKIGELPLGVPDNLIPYVTQTAAGKREQLTIFGDDYDTPDGTCVRDYIHVVDLARAHVSALSYLKSRKEKVMYDFVNVGIGQGKSVMEVVKAFEKVTGEKLNYTIGDRRPGDIEKIYADVAKSESLLNWRAEESIENALLHAWNWQKTLD